MARNAAVDTRERQESANNPAAMLGEINRLFSDLVFDLSTTDKQLSPGEETLYHQVSSYIEHQDQLSRFIPSPPTQLLALMKELESEHSDFDRIHAIVKEDLGLLGEIIKVSNSPLYRPRSGEIGSLDKAISMLGIEGVMKVASVVMMRKVIDVDSSRFKHHARSQWEYCLKCAEACQLMGDPARGFSNYLLGLIHNIGAVTVFSCFVEALNSSVDSAVNVIKVIQRIMLERAPWLSALVAGEWGMPELFLLTLDEFDQLLHGRMDAEGYRLRSELTRLLEAGVLSTQVYTLMKQGYLDRETGLAGLEELQISAADAEKLFSRLELAEASIN
jgi:HD-like signal output (HDOD) protein